MVDGEWCGCGIYKTGGKEYLVSLVRYEESDGKIARIINYAFCPDTLALRCRTARTAATEARLSSGPRNARPDDRRHAPAMAGWLPRLSAGKLDFRIFREADLRPTIWLAACTVMLLATMPSLAGALDANSARAFVQKLYSHYPQKEGGPYYDPTGKNANEVFEPGMIAAFREDMKLANGEVGFVDGDPICMCQDDSGLKPKIISVTLKGPNDRGCRDRPSI